MKFGVTSFENVAPVVTCQSVDRCMVHCDCRCHGASVSTERFTKFSARCRTGLSVWTDNSWSTNSDFHSRRPLDWSASDCTAYTAESET